MQKWRFWLVLCVAVLCINTTSFGQYTLPKIRFVASEQQQFGFDDFSVLQWEDNYETLVYGDSLLQPIPFKSVGKGKSDVVNLYIDPSVDSLNNLRFSVNDSLVRLKTKRIAQDTIQLTLPASQEDYLLKVYRGKRLETALRVISLPVVRYKLKFVPLVGELQEDSIRSYLNQVFAQAGVSIEVAIEKRYQLNDEIDPVFANPSVNHDKFTTQMIEVRDDYFDQFGVDKETYYVFLVEGFVAQHVRGYMVRNKGVGFVKFEQKDLYREIAHQLGYGIGALDDVWSSEGPAKGSTENLMDKDGTDLTKVQWVQIRTNGSMVSYYDEFENVRANNGIIAFYLWEENEDGTIKMPYDNGLRALSRPFKRNTYSMYLNIDNFLFVQLFNIGDYPICLLHILSLLIFGVSSVWLRRLAVKKINFIQRTRLFRFLTRTLSFSVHVFLFWLAFLAVNEGYYMFEVDSGKIESLTGKSLFKTERALLDNINQRRNTEEHLGSELLIKRGDTWKLEKKKPVLYFNIKTKGGKRTMRFYKDEDEIYLATKKYRKRVQTHYFVFRYLDENNELMKERVFNHLGINLTDKLTLDDPAERIVLFVNGYRPTSLGSSFEDNFTDIRAKGLEFPNSSNVIHRDDRYEYWRPWNQIDVRFAKRLNATATYYADGHHSVATSNHESLIDFTRHSLDYPKRCKNPDHHVCKTQKSGWKWLGLERDVPTYESQPLDPNVEGFNERRDNGRIAGRNLLQLLNEIPSNSGNDTLYIVAHSMGYAYALGIVDKMRGKVNFGGFYIIAAENAESGEVKEEEWKEIWQYGSDFEAHKISAPCLLDGIAPQTKASGLSPRNRVYIPEKYYTRMGFFDSHFIGHYTWIFDIPKGDAGYIEQR